MVIRQNLLLVGAILGLLIATPLSAEADIEARLSKMERLVNSQTLLEMLERMDLLQAELQEMRAFSEEQAHQIESLKQRQRDLYLDIDRRISRAEREGGLAQSAATSGAKNRPLVSDSRQQAKGQNTAKAEPAELEDEREAYQKAFTLLRQLKYDPATKAFKRFIKKYPKGRYAHIAQYWLGEANYARNNFKQAIIDYQLLMDLYPNSPKVPEAMLKLGYSRWKLKAVIGAKKILDQLVSKYPDSVEAKQAQPLINKLHQRMNKK